MLPEYYAERGWDHAGAPTRETLERLKLTPTRLLWRRAATANFCFEASAAVVDFPAIPENPDKSD